MTRDKDRKRIIRNRMGKTGESYTAARAHVLSKAPTTSETAAEALAERAGIAEATIKARTGRGWRQWTTALDADGAASWPHREIASLVRDKYGVGDWWGQAVTVGYERIKGLRELGQRRDGFYEANKSKTYDVPVRKLFHAWADTRTRKRWLADVNPSVRTKSPLKAIRLRWPDGTIVIAGFTGKGAKKSMVALAHTKLPSKATAAASKVEWAARLDALGQLLRS
jgi:hypothetical protein